MGDAVGLLSITVYATAGAPPTTVRGSGPTSDGLRCATGPRSKGGGDSLVNSPTRKGGACHADHRRPREHRFVRDEPPQWVEYPTVLATPLRPANRHPVADPLQICQGESAPRVLGMRHQLLRNAGVFVGAKPVSLPSAFRQQTLRGRGAFPRPPRTEFRVAQGRPHGSVHQLSQAELTGGVFPERRGMALQAALQGAIVACKAAAWSGVGHNLTECVRCMSRV